MMNSRRNFNKKILLTAGLSALVPSKSFSANSPSVSSLFLTKWNELYDKPPMEYLTQLDSSYSTFDEKIKQQFMNDTTVKVKGLLISHIELAVLAVMES